MCIRDRGAFGTAEVTLTPSSESPGAVGTLLECWEITLPEDHSDSHVLHLSLIHI